MSKLFLPAREPLLKYGLMSAECFNELLVKLNFGHAECAKAALSKGLGLGLIAGSTLVKLPQVFKILGSSSAQGISLLGTLLELVAVTAACAYSIAQGYPFSSYGEAVFLSAQTGLIAVLILLFGGRAALAAVFAALYAAIVYALVTPGKNVILQTCWLLTCIPS